MAAYSSCDEASDSVTLSTLLRTTVVAALVVGGVVLSDVRSVAAADKWNRVDSAHFSVVGDVDNARLKSLAAGLEQFRLATTLLFPSLRVVSGRSLTIVVVNNDQESFGLGATTNVGGYFANDIDGDVIVMQALPFGDAGLQTILHEYEHAILDATFGRLPRWAHEGLASFYETFRASGDGKYEIGRPGVHAGVFRTVPPIALERFLNQGDASMDIRDAYDAQLFYAESWALVHFFTFGDDGKWRGAFGPFLKSVSEGAVPVDTLQRLLGNDFATFKTHFASYARGRIFSFATARFDVDKDTGALAGGSLSVAETAYLQGRLMTNHKKARKIVADALKAEPDNPKLLWVRANHLLEDRQTAEAAAAYADLAKKDKGDASVCGTAIFALNLAGRAKAALETCSPASGDLLASFGRSVALEMEGRDAESAALRPRFDAPPRWLLNALRQQEWRYLEEGRFTGARRAAATIIATSGEPDDAAYSRFVRWAAGCLDERCDDAREILKKDPPSFESGEWPRKVHQFLTGGLAAVELIKAAKGRDQQTEARTYVAIDLLGRGQRQRAFEELLWVATNGSDAVSERQVAQALYHRLGGR